MEGKQEAKRVKLTIPQQNQGVTPVNPENTAGKCSELEPILGGEIANLPNESGTEAGMSAVLGGSIPNPGQIGVSRSEMLLATRGQAGRPLGKVLRRKRRARLQTKDLRS